MSSVPACLVAAVIAVVAAVELVDPTMPPTHAAAASAPELRLQAIFHTREREFAVIDGRRVSQGDRVGAWRVVEIRPDAVRLRDGAHQLELRLAPAIRREVTPGGEP